MAKRTSLISAKTNASSTPSPAMPPSPNPTNSLPIPSSSWTPPPLSSPGPGPTNPSPSPGAKTIPPPTPSPSPSELKIPRTDSTPSPAIPAPRTSSPTKVPAASLAAISSSLTRPSSATRPSPLRSPPSPDETKRMKTLASNSFTNRPPDSKPPATDTPSPTTRNGTPSPGRSPIPSSSTTGATTFPSSPTAPPTTSITSKASPSKSSLPDHHKIRGRTYSSFSGTGAFSAPSRVRIQCHTASNCASASPSKKLGFTARFLSTVYFGMMVVGEIRCGQYIQVW